MGEAMDPGATVMQKIQLPPELSAKLNQVTNPTELCDDAGVTNAVVLPVEMYREMFSAWANSSFNDADLHWARNEPGGYTTSEVIAKIEKLAAERGRK